MRMCQILIKNNVLVLNSGFIEFAYKRGFFIYTTVLCNNSRFRRCF